MISDRNFDLDYNNNNDGGKRLQIVIVIAISNRNLHLDYNNNNDRVNQLQ